MPLLSRLRVRWQLATTYVVVGLVTLGRGELRPEVHGYLADRWYKLAALEENDGDRRAAWRHRRIARRHAELGPPDPLPPVKTAAMAMPVPREPIFTDARGTMYDDDDGA